VTLHLLYFGVLKDFFEAEHDHVELPDHSTVADLLALLRDGVSELPVWSSLAVAVNREYATLDSPLHDGDEVALLPPVSGGASCA
jgi:molybdopterin converting factor subunit 1